MCRSLHTKLPGTLFQIRAPQIRRDLLQTIPIGRRLQKAAQHFMLIAGIPFVGELRLGLGCSSRSGFCSPMAFIVPSPYMPTAFSTSIEAFKSPASTAAEILDGLRQQPAELFLGRTHTSARRRASVAINRGCSCRRPRWPSILPNRVRHLLIGVA